MRWMPSLRTVALKFIISVFPLRERLTLCHRLKGGNRIAQGNALGNADKNDRRPEGAQWNSMNAMSGIDCELFRPFRATEDFAADTQGVALG
jgi:hypothetical protein